MIPVVQDEIRLAVSIHVADVEMPGAEGDQQRSRDRGERSVRLSQRNSDLTAGYGDEVGPTVPGEIGHDGSGAGNRHGSIKRPVARVQGHRVRALESLLGRRAADV